MWMFYLINQRRKNVEKPAGILGDKTIDDKLMYIHNYDTQN